MALYLGSSEINPVETVEVIKEVPTEQDLTLMGNELRRAYAYTNETDISNQYIFTNKYKNPVVTSSPVSATNISFKAYNENTSYCIMDGKLYTISSNGTFTQSGTDTTYVKYCGNTLVTTTKAGSLNISSTDVVYGHSNYYFIVNGALYRGTQIIDNSGTWTDVTESAYTGASSIGLRDNAVMVIRTSDNAIKQVSNLSTMTQISHFHYSNNKTMVANSNSVFFYFNGLTYANADTATPTTATYQTSIKKINPNMVLLTNGDLYFLPSNTRIDTNVLDICDSLQIYCKSDGVYFAYANGSASVSTFDKIYSFGSNCILDTNYYGTNHNYSFICKTDDNAVQKTTIFSLNNENTAYSDIANLNSHMNITSKTDLKIVLNNKDYFRDTANDSIFQFVPPELVNHTYTDQELCQAYLSAGIRQQQNS